MENLNTLLIVGGIGVGGYILMKALTGGDSSSSPYADSTIPGFVPTGDSSGTYKPPNRQVTIPDYVPQRIVQFDIAIINAQTDIKNHGGLKTIVNAKTGSTTIFIPPDLSENDLNFITTQWMHYKPASQ